jgi:hypothetical protein
MPPSQYVAILRCQTWNTWPERVLAEHPATEIPYGAEEPLQARIALVCYDNRTSPERYLPEETKLGPLLWNGETHGLHRVRDTVLKAPEDVVEVAWQHRNAHRGEVDVCINFRFNGKPSSQLHEALRSTALALVSLINLQLKDYLVPSAPFQLHRVREEGGSEFASSILLAVRARRELHSDELPSLLSGVVHALEFSVYGEKLRVALELYAAHFTESQVRVRFLLLVMAMEALAQPTQKHDTTLSIIDRWSQELQNEMLKFPAESEECRSMEALSRELLFRREDSIRSQVRRLFSSLHSTNPVEGANAQRRALRIYDKRSALVHDGFLPTSELSELEREARDLLELLFASLTGGEDKALAVQEQGGA